MPQPQARRGNTISAGRQHIPSIPKCTVDGHGELCVLDSALLRSAILSSSNLPVLTKTLGGTRFLNTLPCRKARWTLWWTSRMPLEQLNSVKQEEQHPHHFFFVFGFTLVLPPQHFRLVPIWPSLSIWFPKPWRSVGSVELKC